MIACLIALFAHQNSQTVTYTNFGARTEVVLAELSKLYAQKLAADDSVKDRPLTIRVVSADASTLLAKIAIADEGRWVMRGDTKTLVVDSDAREKKAAAAFEKHSQHRLQGIQAFIKETKTEDKPLRKLVAEILQAIGPETLANADPAYQQIYSNRPHPMERPLPDLEPEVMVGLSRVDFYDDAKPTKRSVARVLVRIGPDVDNFDVLSAYVTALASDGEDLGDAGYPLSSDGRGPTQSTQDKEKKLIDKLGGPKP